ncbi:FtsW/RodA/SpoVE family cell cycle protein [Gardnerella vaginalis]|uniref:FtsW/RodA/SpoVE family cell cycle protein n=1 Tax=Gardnerella vaginalis TaxID=2702 RepID=UPI0039EF482D
MTLTRIRQIALLVFSMVISAIAFFQMFLRIDGYMSTKFVSMLVLIAVLYIILWVILLFKKPFASQVILPCMLLLTSIGTVMIARIDKQLGTNIAFKQMIWISVALVLSILLVLFIDDYRILRRFSYVSMIIGLVLLLSPMIPGLGKEIGGARIWIGFGDHTLQPSEFAKLFLSFFFAAYLFNHRDRLAVGGAKIFGAHLPRLKDTGPIAIIWAVSMGVLVIQHDLGTSLMFFAMFVSMLYVSTGRKSWLAIGFIAFVIGCLVATKLFAHVQYRVDAWLHPFDSEVYNRFPGGSAQIVSGLFGLASGGTMGTGLGKGHPAITPLANSDFIYASVGEELGLTGLLAILMLYLIIITSGIITAMKIKDGFGKLLASGLVFTMAFQVFTVVGGITLVIPLTGLTMPYMAAGGSSLVANYLLAAILIIISHSANKPESTKLSESFQYEALAALRERELQERAEKGGNISNSEDSEGNEYSEESEESEENSEGDVNNNSYNNSSYSYNSLNTQIDDESWPELVVPSLNTNVHSENRGDRNE